MIKLLILADDLTGALDAGVQLARRGATVEIYTDYEMRSWTDSENMPEVLVFDTESRHIPPEEAYKRIKAIVTHFSDKESPKIYKKTDSALRGNVGIELEAVVRTGKGRVIHFVPAYPKTGRITSNGIHYVNGVPLSESVFAKDLINPVTESSVEGIIAQQSSLPVLTVHESDSVKTDITKDDPKIILYDCTSDQSMDRIAECISRLPESDLLAGCAGFLEKVKVPLSEGTAPYIKLPADSSLMVLCGTTNPVSSEQLDRAEALGAYRMKLDMAGLMSRPDWKEALEEKIASYREQSSGSRVKIISTCIRDGAASAENLAAKMDLKDRIADGFGWIASRLDDADTEETLMVIGGDTLLGVMNRLGVNRFYPRGELAPGVVLSEFDYKGRSRWLISKSGGFGDPDLFEKISSLIIDQKGKLYMNCNLKLPKSVYSGAGTLEALKDIIRQNNVKKVAAFTDKSLQAIGLFALVEKQLKDAGVEYLVFDDIPSEPAYQAVQTLIDRFREADCDLIVACGGGSVLDTAKLAGILKTDEYGVKDLLDTPLRGHKTVPVAAIPTTAGTGAEATPNAIVGVPEQELKIGIVNPDLISDYVILDPVMIRDLPRSIAAATGVDAMCHAIECFTSNKANPFSDTFALDALDKIMNNITEACDNPEATDAKAAMQIASFYAGIAITASGTTGVHALSYPLGGKYHIAHGVSNAMLLIPVMEFNAPYIEDRLAEAYDRCCHDKTSDLSTEQKAAAMIEWMRGIVEHLEIPTSLKAFGVPDEDLETLVESGMKVTRLLVNNKRIITPDDAREIYRRIM